MKYKSLQLLQVSTSPWKPWQLYHRSLVQSAAAYREWFLQMSLLGRTNSLQLEPEQRQVHPALEPLQSSLSNPYLESLTSNQTEGESSKKSFSKRSKKLSIKKEEISDEERAEFAAANTAQVIEPPVRVN